jgi:integrase
MLTKVRATAYPGFGGPMLVDTLGVPRYWATVWMSFLPPDLAPSTLGKKLTHLDSFYQHSDHSLGLGGLDDALADLNVEALRSALEAYFLSLRNQFAVTPATEERWQAALHFVIETVQRLTRSSLAMQQLDSLRDRLLNVQLLNSHLHVGRRRRPERIRSLPAEVVEALYQMLDPESPSNPFVDLASRWRVYTIFMLLLHQGLRRGELLSFPVDVIKSAFDRKQQRIRYWMDVRYNQYESEDPRYSTPGIKNASSIRQIPVSKPTALLVQEYVMNYRGKPDHSFLISSKNQRPLSTEGITKIFQKITASLPNHLRKLLMDMTGEESISAHHLRHTCAVVRLNQLLTSGVEMTDALERMRPFFGWARNSDEPLRYARTVFEDRLASVWNDSFDEQVAILRNLPVRLK